MPLIGLYLAYMATSVALLAAGFVVYIMVTPHKEVRLIRDGNVAAAWSMGGTVVGLALPLASAMANSVNLMDMALWGGVAVVTQLLAFVVVSLTLRDFRAGIEADRVGYGVTLAAVSVGFGILNAGALTY